MLPRWVVAALIGLVALPLLPASSQAVTATVPCSDRAGCPDLVVDPARMRPFLSVERFSTSSCSVVEGEVAAGTRTLLRFTQTTPNQGPGALVIGSPKKHPEWFEHAPCHGHYHFRSYADYRLWTPADHGVWEELRTANPGLTAAEVLERNPGLAPLEGHKQGFCAIDLVRYDSTKRARFTSCSNQGISAGWADEYDASLSGQWIDVTGLAAGTYVLETEVNAERLFEERTYANNRASVLVSIPAAS